LPGQYWRRTVQFKNFKVDFFFIDGNVFDTTLQTDEAHNICSKTHNPGQYCESDIYPGDGSNCAATGPHNPADCTDWFKKLWQDIYNWLTEEVPKSDAEWQIVVGHYPPQYSLGYAPNSYMNWEKFLQPMGIDLFIAGHTHEQRVYYGDFGPGRNMGDSAWVITGGGGGVTTEVYPDSNGEDDAYGFMEMTVSLQELKITAYSHGGTEGKKIIRNQTTVVPVPRNSDEELVALGYMKPKTVSTPKVVAPVNSSRTQVVI